MKKADQVCKYLFFTYLALVIAYGTFSWFLAFFDDNMAILDPYEGRAGMYLDYMHE